MQAKPTYRTSRRSARPACQWHPLECRPLAAGEAGHAPAHVWVRTEWGVLLLCHYCALFFQEPVHTLLFQLWLLSQRPESKRPPEGSS